METQGIQINKFISSAGFCSRREADLLVEQGRVTINGKLAKSVSRVGEQDKVAVDDEVIRSKRSESLYIAFNKPKGITSTTDEKDRSSITGFINHNKRIFPIGRLDKDSEGLILLTDDGDIVNKILRAGNEHEKEYIVSVDKPLTPEFIKKMAEGVHILDTVTKPCIVRSLGNKKFKIILTQGLNRQIRRMCEVLGYKVSELKRMRVMHIQLGDLPIGKWRKLNAAEIERMNEFVKHSSKTAGKEFQSSGSATSFPKKGKSREHYKHAPQFNREDRTSNKKASKFIRPFKPGDKVLKQKERPTTGGNSVNPRGADDQKNRFVKTQARMKAAADDLGNWGNKKDAKVSSKPIPKGKFGVPVVKDKLTLKKEANIKSKVNMKAKAKHSSRKNFNAKPDKKKPNR